MTDAIDTLLDIRTEIGDAHIIATEECVGAKGKELVKRNGIVLGLDIALTYIDLALERLAA